MKYLRATVTPDPATAPALFALLADSAPVEEARLLDMNVADSRGITGLFAIEGDAGAFERRLADVSGVASADVTPAGDGRFYLLATIQPDAIPLAGGVFRALNRDGLVVVKPVVYRDGEVRARLVGETGAVQGAVETFPEPVAVEVHEIGERGFEQEPTAADLSDRQREAVLAALDLGYYDVPRQGTHRDVAERLGCAPSTASEHLQKAEAKLVRGSMAALGLRGRRTDGVSRTSRR